MTTSRGRRRDPLPRRAAQAGQDVGADGDRLRRGSLPASREPRPPRFQVAANRSGLVPGVEPTRLNQLNDELEVEDFVAESER